ncbi:hypothetical protein WG66_003729 [Moniliophthora roreri]|nr:hypothetical protein WG66_003729 [Moniliophthora roreri]
MILDIQFSHFSPGRGASPQAYFMTPILFFTANFCHLNIDIIASLIRDGAWRQNGRDQGLDCDIGNSGMWYQTFIRTNMALSDTWARLRETWRIDDFRRDSDRYLIGIES